MPFIVGSGKRKSAAQFGWWSGTHDPNPPIQLEDVSSSVTGTVTATLPKLAQSATGKESFTGTTAATLPKLGQSATATHTTITNVTGTVAAALPKLAQAATAKEIITGTVAQIFGNLSASYWNPSDKGSGVTLSNSDKDATGDSSSSVRSVTSRASGKYYFEVQASGAENYIGIANSSANVTTDAIGNDAYGVALLCESGDIKENSSSTPYASGASGGEVFGIAVDLDASKFYVAIDGVWQNSADPAAGTGGYTFAVTGPYFMALTPDFGSTNLRGQDADFTETKPSGFTAWSESVGTFVQQSISATERMSATVAQVAPKLTQSASGLERFNASVAATLPRLEQAIAASEIVVGAAAQVLPTISQVVNGTHSATLVGTVAQILPRILQDIEAIHTETAPTPSGIPAPTGGWKTLHRYGRVQTKDEIRREREKLGIVPKQAKKIEKLADKLADDLPPEPNQMLVQIMASAEFNKLLQAFAQRDAERRAQIAEFAAQEILRMVIAMRDAEEEAIVALILQM